jgi:hypothetical protein
MGPTPAADRSILDDIQLEGRREEVLSDIRLERSEFENMAQRAGPNVQLEAKVGSGGLQVRRDALIVAPDTGVHLYRGAQAWDAGAEVAIAHRPACRRWGRGVKSGGCRPDA